LKINYRPEIDGLRAIAVLAVIIYHAKISFLGNIIFKGGFVGVDIFFVISGYLITSIIYKELLEKNSFSFKYFYERRIRRILPALLIVILVSLPFGWFLLLPGDLIDFSKSILYSLGFTSNFFFHYSGQQYGASDSLLIPFLHTWSLSIEEQFYIFFPVCFLILFKFFKKYLGFILSLTFFISLIIADWGSRNYPSFNFYILPTRGWELIAGSILVYFEKNKVFKIQSHLVKSFLTKTGIILILYSILFFDDKMFHPSFYTLFPIVGVCLILFFSNRKELVTELLSSKILVKTGLISYSLYLWHYPIFAFSRITDFIQGNLFNAFLISILLILLSITSYFFVERPARNKHFSFNYLLKIIFSFYFIIFLFGFLVLKNKGYENRSHFPKLIINTYKNLDYRNISQNNDPCHNRVGKEGFCIFNELDDNSGDVILLGDSLTDALLKNMIEQVSNTKLRLIHMSYSGNLFLPDFISYDKTKLKISSDEKIHEYRKNYIENFANKNSYIIIFGDYNYYFEKRIRFDSSEKIVIYETPHIFSNRSSINLEYDKRVYQLKSKIKSTIEELSKNKKIILIYPAPISPTGILNRIKNLSSKGKLKKNNFYLEDKVNYDKDFYTEYNSEVIDMINNIRGKNIFKIKLGDVFCPKQQCFFYDNNYSYFFDDSHPSYEGSKKINNLIIEKIKIIEKISKK
tara:strand:+ start:1096 stop:3162 length:2067 start_codon:yes stop_codon:yes gene_type:complete